MILNLKKKEKDIKENIEKFEQEIRDRKKIPQYEKKKLLKKIFKNMLILFIILIYIFILQIGEENIETETYKIILKTLSIVLICVTTIMFEISYKTNKNEIILHSIEILTLSFFTLFLISAYSLYYGSFYKVIQAAMIAYTVYYLVKSIIIRKIYKKKYYESINDIKTIVAKR